LLAWCIRCVRETFPAGSESALIALVTVRIAEIH
jgi:hypothetical protein